VGEVVWAREFRSKIKAAGYRPPTVRLNRSRFQVAAYPLSERGTGIVIEAGNLEWASRKLLEEVEIEAARRT
jgi:hypothetical protein